MSGVVSIVRSCLLSITGIMWHSVRFTVSVDYIGGCVVAKVSRCSFRIRTQYDCESGAKAPFIATQLNSTQLDVELS